jgi:hypothetical protein
MRQALAALALVLLAWQACAMNWRLTTRADHKSLDVVMRRLDYAIAHSSDPTVTKELNTIREHLLPVYTRHGGPISWWEGSRIKLGSEAELNLVCTQHGYANTTTDRSERRKDIALGFFRWLKQSLSAIVLGMGPWVIAFVICVVVIRYRGKIIRAYDEDAEKIPGSQRKAAFTNPLVKKAHAKIKKKTSQ